jgi:hypothetical protein
VKFRWKQSEEKSTRHSVSGSREVKRIGDDQQAFPGREAVVVQRRALGVFVAGQVRSRGRRVPVHNPFHAAQREGEGAVGGDRLVVSSQCGVL